MKDLIILTDKPICSEIASPILKENWKNLNILSDKVDFLYMKKKRVGFEIEYTPNDILDDPNNWMEDTVDKCPNKKAYLTNVHYTSVYVAKKIISLLEPLFGNMWIQSDEYDDWFGTAKEFLENYEKYLKENNL